MLLIFGHAIVVVDDNKLTWVRICPCLDFIEEPRILIVKLDLSVMEFECFTNEGNSHIQCARAAIQLLVYRALVLSNGPIQNPVGDQATNTISIFEKSRCAIMGFEEGKIDDSHILVCLQLGRA